MPTINQLVKKWQEVPGVNESNSPILKQCPQKRGVCMAVRTMTPKKPNSALRKIARVRLVNGMEGTAYIRDRSQPQEHSVVTDQGRKGQRPAGRRYHIIRGASIRRALQTVNRRVRATVRKCRRNKSAFSVGCRVSPDVCPQ